MAATKQSTTHTGGPYQVPPDPNRWGAIGLAVGVHALLLTFLWVGVSWQNNAPVAVEAEIWDTSVQSAAPPPPPPQEVEEPKPEPEPVPPPPVPREIAPPKVDVPPPPKVPDIALEREKKRKEELKRQQEEERLERERERELAQKREDEKKAKALAEKKEREQAEKKELAKQEALKKEADKKKAEELAKKEAADKKKKAEKEAKAKEDAMLAKLRDAELKSVTGAGTSGTAAKSTAPRIDKGYEAAIQAKVKGNTSYGGSLDEPGNPTATFRVEQLPTGEIITVKKLKSSGVPAFDDAVEKGINKSSPLPKKKDGTVERTLVIDFHMKDMQ